MGTRVVWVCAVWVGATVEVLTAGNKNPEDVLRKEGPWYDDLV